VVVRLSARLGGILAASRDVSAGVGPFMTNIFLKGCEKVIYLRVKQQFFRQARRAAVVVVIGRYVIF
jgi:hypothetical protein